LLLGAVFLLDAMELLQALVAALLQRLVHLFFVGVQAAEDRADGAGRALPLADRAELT